jgi:nucleotide-binding universal stress UspA family protein
MYRALMPIDTGKKRALAQVQAVKALPAASESVEVILLHVAGDDGGTEAVREMDAGELAVESLTGDLPVAAVETEVRRGEVAEEILAAADGNDADVIVLGGRKRSPMGSLIFGSISTDVLVNARRPVMITGDHLEAERDEAPLLGDEQDDVHETPRHDSDEPGPYRVPSGTERESPERRNPPEFSEDRSE